MDKSEVQTPFRPIEAFVSTGEPLTSSTDQGLHTPVTEPADGSAECSQEPLDSAEMYSLTRGAVKDAVRGICKEETTSLINSIHSEVGSFEQRLADSGGAEGNPAPMGGGEAVEVAPQVQAPQLQDFLAQLGESIHHHSDQLEGKLEGMLDHVSVCLQEELSREQEHLMLMQHNIDTQSHNLTKATADLTKRMDAEKNARMMLQLNIRENKDSLQSQISFLQTQVDDLKVRLEQSSGGGGGTSLSFTSLYNYARDCVASCCPTKMPQSQLLLDDMDYDAPSDYRPLTNVVNEPPFDIPQMEGHVSAQLNPS